MSLQGKTLFITGASRGIGLAIAKKAGSLGANVVIAAKSSVPNPKLPGTIFTAAAEVEAAGGHIVEVGTETLCRPEEIEAAITDQTVAILHLPWPNGKITLAETVVVGRRHGVPNWP